MTDLSLMRTYWPRYWAEMYPRFDSNQAVSSGLGPVSLLLGKSLLDHEGLRAEHLRPGGERRTIVGIRPDDRLVLDQHELPPIILGDVRAVLFEPSQVVGLRHASLRMTI